MATVPRPPRSHAVVAIALDGEAGALDVWRDAASAPCSVRQSNDCTVTRAAMPAFCASLRDRGGERFRSRRRSAPESA